MRQFIQTQLDKLRRGPLKAGSFIRNVFTVFAGTAISQAIALAAIPVLSRIFAPEDFGVLATSITFVTLFSIIANLSYQSAAVLPKRDETAFALWVMCLLVSLLISLVIGGTLFVLRVEVAEWVGYPELAAWMWLAPLWIWALAGFSASSMLCTRHKKFMYMSKGLVATRLTTAGGQIGSSAVTTTPMGLISGQMLGTLAGFSYLANKILRQTPARLWRYANRKNFAILLYRYREFPTYGLFSSLAAAIARNLPIILLSYFFSAATVGFFSVAFRIVAGPFQLGAVSVTNVFYQKSNEARKDGNLGEVTKQTFERLGAIFMTPLLLLSIGAAEIVVLLLGDKWAPTANYLSWLCLWFFFIAIASPLHRLFAVLERQSELAILNGLLFVFSAGGLITGGLMEDPQMAVILFCLASSLVWMAQGVRTMAIGGAGGLTYFRLILLEFSKSAPFGAALYAGRILTDDIFAVTGMTLCLLAIFGILRVKFILGRKIRPLGAQNT